MKYWKHLVLTAVLATAACDGEEPPPTVLPPVSGTVSGTVTIDGVGMAGITATISSGGSATTDNSGNFSLSGVPEGTHTVTLTGYEDDVQFSATTLSVEITRQVPTASLTYAGAYIRTSSVFGSVTVEGGNVLSGVTVRIAGGPESIAAEEVTDAQGQYSFTGLRKGTYNLSISGFNTTRYGFSQTSVDLAVGLGETGVANFEGEFTAHAHIQGAVMYETVPAPGVTVSLTGGLSSPPPMTTDADGRYSFPSLKPGTYMVTISDYASDVSFAITSLTYTVDDHQVKAATFQGLFDRSAAIGGTVFVGAAAVRGAVLTLSGTFAHGAENDELATTNAQGEYDFDHLREGSYTVTLTDLPDDEMDFHGRDEATIMLAMGESSDDHDFKGHDGWVNGMVTVEGAGGLEGVTVTLAADHRTSTATTDGDGMYGFGNLRPGSYQVSISGYDEKRYDFEATTATVELASSDGGAEHADFMGMYVPLASISGAVMYEEFPAPGVTVALSGGLSAPEPAMTDDMGRYAFPALKPGTYTVTISGYAADVTFPSASATYPVDDAAVEAAILVGMFDRTGSISGTVFVGDQAVHGADLTISGTFAHGVEDDELLTTNAQGEYEFDDLREGSYTVTLTDLPDDEMDFHGRDEMMIMLAMGASSDDHDFMGHDGWVNGMVTVEGAGGLEGVTVTLAADHRTSTATTDGDGMYGFGNLRPGSYEVSISGYDAKRYGFEATTATVTLASSDGAAEHADFMGMYVPLASISGAVMYEKYPAPGVTVALSGGLSAPEPAMTDDMGRYAFPALKPGTYTVTISGYAADVTFPSASATYPVDDAAVEAVDLVGMFDRTGSISGTVFVGDQAVHGADLTISGTFAHGTEDDVKMTTNAQGQFSKNALRKGSYSVTVTDLPDDEMDFHGRDEMMVELAMGENSDDLDFMGHDGWIKGMVMVEGLGGLEGVTVTLTSEHRARTATTDAAGAYGFGNLRPADYGISIAGYDDTKYEFEVKSSTVTVEGDGANYANFDGMYEAMAGVSGVVSYEGVAAEGITVSLSGGLSEPAPATTDEMGKYSFADLKPGTYTVTVSDYASDATFDDAAQVTLTSENLSAVANFDGAIARDQTLSGTVFVDGVARTGITVKAAATFDYGPGEYTMSTGTTQGGAYQFTNLRMGDYTVTIEATPEELGYDFAGADTMTASVAAGGGSAVDFHGVQKREARIHGHLFLDEDGKADRKRNTSLEDDLTVAGVPIILSQLGRAVGAPQEWMAVDTTMTDSMGYYAFENQTAGEYRVTLVLTDTIIPGNVALTSANDDDRSLWWNGEWVHDYAFMITQQRIDQTVAFEKGGPVAGWTVCLYETQSDAAAAAATTTKCATTGLLTSASTDSVGVAKLRFPRSDDENPGGKSPDMVAFAVAIHTHPADPNYHDELMADDPERIVEVTWSRQDSLATAPAGSGVELNYDLVHLTATIVDPAGMPADGWDIGLTLTAGTKPEMMKSAKGAVTFKNVGNGLSTALALVPDTVQVFGGVDTDTVPNDSLYKYVLAAQTANDSVGLSYGKNAGARDNAFKGTYTVRSGAKLPKDKMSITYATNGLVPPDSVGYPGTVDLGTIAIAYTEVDVVAAVYRELDDIPGITPGDYVSRKDDQVVLSLATKVKLGSSGTALYTSGSDTLYGGYLHAWDNVSVGTAVITTMSRDTASMVALDDSVTLVLDGSVPIVEIQTPYKRKDGEITVRVHTSHTNKGVTETYATGHVVTLMGGGLTKPLVDTIPAAGTQGNNATFATFPKLLDAEYVITIPSGMVVGGSTSNAADTMVLWMAADRDTVGAKTCTAGKTWTLGKDSVWTDTVPACNLNAYTATRRMAQIENEVSLAAVDFLSHRMDTEISGSIYNDRTPAHADDFGNVLSQGLAGATVTLLRKEGKVTEAVGATETDDSGEFAFDSLPEGEYILLAGRSGFVVSPDTVSVTTDPTYSGHVVADTTMSKWLYDTNMPETGKASFTYRRSDNTLTVNTVHTANNSVVLLPGVRVRLAICTTATGADMAAEANLGANACTAYKTNDGLLEFIYPISSNGGVHVFQGLVEGVYEIRAEHDQYRSDGADIVVKGQDQQNVKIQVTMTSG